jgi:outer membrane lipoprotein-sorting protein
MISIITRSIKILLIFTAVWFFLPAHGLAAPPSVFQNLEKGFDPLDIIAALDEGYARVQDYTATFLKQEYIGGRILPLETIALKFRKPNDVYMKWLTRPNKGQEVVYRHGVNEGKITAHKGGLLGLVTVNLDPRGSMAMKDQHHPIYDAGIGSTTALVKRGLRVGIERKEYEISYRGDKSLDGRETILLEAIFPERCEGITHVVRAGETLWDIAEKYDQDMYIILHSNPGIRGPNDIEAGSKVLVPYHYGRRIVVYIDRELALLVKLDIYDWEGNLYETYQYKNLKINVGLTDEDFDPANPAYNF